MTRLEIPALVLGSLCIAAGLRAQDGDEHLLRYNLKKGTVVHFQKTTRQDVKIDTGGREMSMNMDVQMFMELSVLDDAGGNFQVAQKLYRVKLKTKNPMIGEVDFDTDDEDSVPPGGDFDGLLDVIGQSMTATIDPRGKIVELVIPEELKEAMSGLTGIDRENKMSEMFVEFPDGPVAVGATWETERQQSTSDKGEISFKTTNKLASVDGVNATIEQDIEMDFGDGLPVQPEVEKAETKLVIDTRTGLPESMTSTVQLNVKGNQGGMKMDVRQQINGSMKRVAPPKTTEPAAGKGDKTDK